MTQLHFKLIPCKSKKKNLLKMLTGKIFTITEVAGTGNKTVILEW